MKADDEDKDTLMQGDRRIFTEPLDQHMEDQPEESTEQGNDETVEADQVANEENKEYEDHVDTEGEHNVPHQPAHGQRGERRVRERDLADPRSPADPRHSADPGEAAPSGTTKRRRRQELKSCEGYLNGQ